jgi:hypothetical protein
MLQNKKEIFYDKETHNKIHPCKQQVNYDKSRSNIFIQQLLKGTQFIGKNSPWKIYSIK